MRPLISLLSLFSILLFQVVAHRCVLRDTSNEAPTILPDSRINDDYCDCLDGSDEKRTAACPNGIFICENTAYRKKSIPASWVRDGSCDCCDGSDEAPGRCPDNCAILREKNLKEAKQRADTVMRGVAIREKYVKQVSGALEKDARELRKLQRELVAIERALNESKARADALRMRRDWERRLPVAEHGNPVSSSSSTEKPTVAGRQLDDDDDDYHYDGSYGEKEEKPEDPVSKESDSDNRKDDDDDDTDDEEEEDDLDDEEKDLQDQQDETSSQDGEDEEDLEDDDLEDDKGDNDLADDLDDDDDDLVDDVDDDDDEAMTADRRAEEEHETNQGDSHVPLPSASASKGENEPEAAPEPTVNVDAVCADLQLSSSNHVFRMVWFARAVLLSKLHRILPKIFPVQAGSAISGLDECIRKADSATWKFESEKTSIEEKINNLKKKQTTDYGADKALRKLHGQCTKTKVMQYEFEHCPFDLVRQYEHGSAIATLGRFDGWEVDGNERYMKYSRGDTCWNGPARSIKVQLLCGEKEEIVSVDEPNRCTYFMKFLTPAVCEKKMAEEIMSEFGTDSEQKEEL